MSLHRVLAAERADVSGVLGDFHLLDLLPERCTISGGKDSASTLLDNAISPTAAIASPSGRRRSREAAAHLVPYLPVTPTSITLSVPPTRGIRVE